MTCSSWTRKRLVRTYRPWSGLTLRSRLFVAEHRHFTDVGGRYSTPSPESLRLREKHLGIPQNEIICDFCSARDPEWEYENYPSEEEDGGWAACTICKELIEADERAKLFERSVAC